MFRIEAKSNPRFIEAFFIILLIIITMAYSIGYLKAAPHIPIFLVIAIFAGLWVMEESIFS